MTPTSMNTLTDTRRHHTRTLMQSRVALTILIIVRAQDVFVKAQATMAKDEPTRLRTCSIGRLAGSTSAMCLPTPRLIMTVPTL